VSLATYNFLEVMWHKYPT